MRREYLALGILVVVIVFGVGYKYALLRGAGETGPPVTGEPASAKILVHVTGAVEAPGVYEFEQGARVNDAVLRARPTATAQVDALNLAALLEDGQKILVPEIPPEPVVSTAPSAGGTAVPLSANTASPTNSLININTADAAVLEQLPGIGPSLAQRIVQYRQQHGPFLSVDDLANVSGIGDKKMADIRPLITVR
ncbi:MAG: ComEA family DNA-binding protein [Bacillota bacterium]